MVIQKIDQSRWKEYKDLRIKATSDSPCAFLSTPQETVLIPEKIWRDWIQNMFFAIDTNNELIGMIGCVKEKAQKIAHVMKFVSVYVTPSERGKGIGKELLQTAIEFAKSDPTIKTIQIGVNPTQKAALALYLSVGFQEYGVVHRAIQVNETLSDEILLEMLV